MIPERLWDRPRNPYRGHTSGIANSGLSQIGDTYTYLATGINDSGEIICHEDPPPFGTEHAAICHGAAVNKLVLSPVDDTNGSFGTAINNKGWIVGYATSATRHFDSFLWTPHGVTDFGPSFVPFAINNDGEVGGEYNGLPAVWTQREGFRMLALPANVISGEVRGLNDAGQIVGSVEITPEPGTAALLLLGAALQACKKIRWARGRECERKVETMTTAGGVKELL
jgi:probable HAF family extracellular repeat protein